ncbi:uncharacterized protein LOC144571419 [Carex rostrata]
MLKCKNEDILSLKTFGCVCFMQGNNPNMEKLDPRAVKFVFVGYSATQKRYVCWNPVERRLFVSMGVTFRELELYYSLETTSSFGNSLDTRVSVGGIFCSLENSAVVEPEKEDSDVVELEKKDSAVVELEKKAQGEPRYCEVYVRRKKQNEGAVPTVPQASPLSLPTSTRETPTPSTSDSDYTGDIIPPSSPPAPLFVAKEDPRWKSIILEELGALEKNKT